MADWNGEGWYAVKYSDGGQDWTNDGALWFERPEELEASIESAKESATETHIPCPEYLGSGEHPADWVSEEGDLFYLPVAGHGHAEDRLRPDWKGEGWYRAEERDGELVTEYLGDGDVPEE